jgi:hypothetical protein
MYKNLQEDIKETHNTLQGLPGDRTADWTVIASNRKLAYVLYSAAKLNECLERDSSMDAICPDCRTHMLMTSTKKESVE